VQGPIRSNVLFPAVVSGLVVASLVGLAFILLRAPVEFENAWGFAHEGRAYALLSPFTQGFEPLAESRFLTFLRFALATMWGGWMLLVMGVGRSGMALSSKAVRAHTIIAVTLAVVVLPPMLSRDVLGYVAYGRLPGLHGLNPYLHGRQALADTGDPTSIFLVWDTPLPYGPLWVLLAAALAKLGSVGGVILELSAHKAVAGVALIGAAIAGGRLAALRHPASERLAVLAIGLNPLLLIEGPGMGHNDVVMTALLLWAALLSARHQASVAALVVGLAVAVKPIAVAAVPFLLAEHWRTSSRSSRALEGVALLALSLMPTLAISVIFGGPAVLVRALVARATAKPTHTLVTIGTWLAIAVLLASWRLCQDTDRRVAAAWLTAWVPIALVIGLVGMPITFPWYMTWSLLPALTMTDRRDVPYVVVATTVAVLLMWRYTVPV